MNTEKPLLENSVIKPKLAIYTKDKNNNDIEHRLITQESETSLDSCISEIESFMNTNHGRGKTELEKDNLYGDAQKIWNKYADTLRNVHYTFYLNRKQFQFLTDLLIDKLEYDVNTVFLAIELKDMLGEWKLEGTNKDDDSLKGYTADATEITYIYHLIAKHKVVGLKHASFRFAEVLNKIGQISKVIAYYDTHAKSLSKDIQMWVASFDDSVEVDGKNWGSEHQETINIQSTTESVSETKQEHVEKPKKKVKKDTVTE